MKKSIVFAAALLISGLSFAQKSFEKNANVISLGADIGGYGYTSVQKSNGDTHHDGAVNKMLNLQYERGILNWLGIGAKLQYNSYITTTDTSTHTQATVNGFDAMVLANAHFVRSKHVDLLAGFTAGFSHLNYFVNDAYASQAKGGGPVFDLHFQPRFYFGSHIGVYINLAYVHYGYNSLDFQNSQTHLSDALSLKGGGVNFGAGLQVKF